MKSIRSKLTLMMVLICAAGMLLVTTTGTLLTQSALQTESQEKIMQSTAKEAAVINGWLENQTTYVRALAMELSSLEDYSLEAMLPRLNRHVDNNAQYFDVYMGYPDGTVSLASGADPGYAGGWRAYERPWYVGAMANTNQAFITEPYTDAQTGGLCITVSKAVLRDGEALGVAGADILIGDLNAIVEGASVGEGSYAFLVDQGGNLLIHPNDAYGPDASNAFQNLATIENGVYAPVLANTTNDGAFAQVRGADGVERYYTAITIGATGWRLYSAIATQVVDAPINQLITSNIVLLLFVLTVAFLMIFFVVKRIIVRPIAEVTQAANLLAQGDTTIAISYDKEDEIGSLVQAFRAMSESIGKQAAVLTQIAAGDYSGSVDIRSDADVMGISIDSILHNMNEVMTELRGSSSQVAAGAFQIAQASQTLAEGSTRQAATIDDFSQAVKGVEAKSHEIVEVAQNTLSDINVAGERMAECNMAMSQMMQAMTHINDSSQSISKVIRVIDDIAFQTNILALNAAVEAARAGQHGKGFAVVAEEVRNLASKSSDAAKETAALIQKSIDNVAEGSQVVDLVNESIQAVAEIAQKNAVSINAMNDASKDQSAAITHITSGIDQLSAVIQANSATAQETAASSEEMSAQSTLMDDIVARFKLRDAALADTPEQRLLD